MLHKRIFFGKINSKLEKNVIFRKIILTHRVILRILQTKLMEKIIRHNGFYLHRNEFFIKKKQNFYYSVTILYKQTLFKTINYSLQNKTEWFNLCVI